MTKCAISSHGTASALVTTVCVHEHLRASLPACDKCLFWLELPDGECAACHDSADSHDCLLTVTVTPLAVTA